MGLLEKFELLDAAADLSGARDQAIPARYRASGKPVLVHILANWLDWPPEKLLSAVAKLPPQHLCRILEVGEHEAVRYVVTDPLPGVPHLRQWVEMLTASPGSGASTGSARITPPAPKAPEPDLQTEPGEFTRLFGATPATPAVPPAKAPVNAGPGEFTALFNLPPAATASRSPELERGEFARLFEKPADGPAKPVPFRETPLSQPQPAATPEVQPIGDFTRMFAAPSPIPASPLAPTPPPRPAAPEPAQAGEFTRMFSAPSATSIPQPLPLPAVPQRPSAPGPSQNEGIFESVTPAAVTLGSVPVTVAPKLAKPVAQAGTPPAQMSYAPMFVILAALFVLAVALIVFFAIWR